MEYTKKRRAILRKDNPPLEFARLQAAIQSPEAGETFEKLNALYQTLPGGECKGCTRCCSESVNVSFGEALNIINFLAQENSPMSEALGHKIMTYYFNELSAAGACPFLENGRCVIYAVRPLQCRLFGVYAREDYEADYLQVREENRNTAALLKETYGITIPENLVERKLPYCEDFVAERLINRDEKRKLMEQLYQPDALLMETGLLKESEWGLSLVAWLARLVIGNHLAGEVRFEAIRGLGKADHELKMNEMAENYGIELASLIQSVSVRK